MFRASRSFYCNRYAEGLRSEEFSSAEPVATEHTVVNIDPNEQELMIADHQYPRLENSPLNHRSWIYEIEVKDWNDIKKLAKIADHHRKNSNDMHRMTSIDAKQVKLREMNYPEDGDDDFESRKEDLQDVSVDVKLSTVSVSFAIIPEPSDPIFPSLGIGDEYSLEGESSDREQLKRFVELLREVIDGLNDNGKLEPILDEEIRTRLNKMKYGHEVIGHVSDGDRCFEMEMNHLALSSYIHAIEWAAIAYLAENGTDIIEKEKGGDLYYFANGKKSILGELKKEADLNQKTISKIEGMNRSERRWMAHHKTGEILPSEVIAIRSRLKSMIHSLYSSD